jgi:hypothetical protein
LAAAGGASRTESIVIEKLQPNCDLQNAYTTKTLRTVLLSKTSKRGIKLRRADTPFWR